MFLRAPDRFRRVRDPNGTILTTFRLPTGPAGPGRAGSENFFGRGSRGSRNFFSPRIFFVQKRYSLGPEWVSGRKNSFWTPLDPQKGPFWPILHTKWPKWDSKTAKKTAFLIKILLQIILFRFLHGLGPSKPQN